MKPEQARDMLEDMAVFGTDEPKFNPDYTEEDIRQALQMGADALEKQVQIENDIGNFSDGFHTFNGLYHQRAVLFATIVNQNKNNAWKTHRHEDGELCFGGGWFLVTVETPQGAYGYHYEDKYWDMFDCEELLKAKHWDGYTEEDVERLLSIGE